MTSVNVTTTKNTVTVNGETRVVTVKTQGPQGPSLPDGDKGDVTVSSNGTAISINNSAITSAKIADGTIVNADINASAAIALSKLATGALPTAITVTSANISDLSIVDADINASAAIQGTKISPDFGSQTIATTGVTNLSGELRANGNIKMTNDSPKITFVDSQDNPDFEIGNLNGVFRIRDTTNSANRLVVNTDGHVDVTGNLDVGSNISVSGTVDGRDVATDGTKLDGIETGATADQTASEILTLLKTVDGAGSGLNADNLDGISSASFLRSDTNATFSGSTLTVNATLLLHDSIRIGDDAFIEDYNAANSVRIKGNQDTSKGFIAFGQQTKQLGCDGTSVLTYDGNTVIDSAYTGALANGITATTQSASDNSTKVATTAYTDTAIANLVDSAPGTLNTLNELAAALGDDANFSTTVTNSIATKLPLAGGTLTGDLTISNTAPSLYFTDTNHDSDFRVMNQNGVFKIFDQTNSADRLEIYSGGQVVIDGNLDVGSGIDITGTITATSSISVPDAVSIFLGTGNDLSLKHDGSNSFLTNATGYLLVNSTGGDNVIRSSNDVYLQPAGGEFGVKAIANGATELYFDNSKKVETTSYGVLSNQSLKAEGDYILLDNSGDASYRLNRNGTALFSIRNNNVHNVHLNTQNSATLSFGVSTGVTSGSIEQQLRIKGDTRHIQIPNDSTKLQIGSSQDLELYHDGSNSYIDETGTGGLYIRVAGTANNGFYKYASNESLATFQPDNAVRLYYDNSKKLETTTYGAKVTDFLNVGKTDTPSKALELYQASNAALRIQNSSTGVGGSDGLLLEQSGLNTLLVNYEAGNIDFKTANNTRLLITSDGNVQIPNDTGKLQLGASQDLQLYHDGSNSYLLNTTGEFQIANSGSGNTIFLQAKAGENSVKAVANGAVELYYDNSKKLETTSTGISVTGNIVATGALDAVGITIGGNTPSLNFNDGNDDPDFRFLVNSNSFILEDTTNSANRLVVNSDGHLQVPNDNQKLQLGASQDLEIFHDGTDSFIKNTTGHLKIGDANVRIMNAACDEDMIHAKQDEQVELYYDNVKKLETTSTGINIEGTAPRISFTDTNHNNFAIIVDGNDFNIQDTTAGENRLNINSTGIVSCNDGLFVPDAKSIFVGNSNDLQLKHDGTDSRIINNGTDLFIYTVGDHDVKILADSQNAVICKPDAAVELYYDNVKKLETTTNGAKLHGHLKLDDNDQLRLGDATAGDFVLVHDATDSIINNATGNLFYRSATHKLQALNGHDMLVGNTGGSVELYYDNSKKLETTSYGVAFVAEAKFDNNTTANRDVIWDPANDQLRWLDSTKAAFGSASDLQIQHDGSNSKIVHNGGGNLVIEAAGSDQDVTIQATDDVFIKVQSNEHAIRCLGDAGVELYFNNNKKLETLDDGVNITGTLKVNNSVVKTGLFSAYARLSDVKAYNVHGGGVPNDNYFVYRTLNTEDFDPDGIILGVGGKATSGNLKSNNGNYSVTTESYEFVLGAGSYFIKYRVPYFQVDLSAAWIIDRTNSDSIIEMSIASGGWSQDSGAFDGDFLSGSCRVTITSNNKYAVRQYFNADRADYGMGHKSAVVGINSIYTVVEIYKES